MKKNSKTICKKSKCEDPCSMKTFLIHGKFKTKKWDYNYHIIPPISSSSAFRLISTERGAKGFEKFLEGGPGLSKIFPIYIYDRLDEPTRGMLEETLAHAEQGEVAVCFGSGMGAISAALGITVKSGDEILCHRTLYGCTFSLFTNWYPKYNIKVKFIDMTKLENVKRNLNKNTKIIYFESPANPTLELIDIEEISKIAKSSKYKPYVIVDNTFATPYCQRPLTLGVDIVAHSLTKGIGGFGTDMGGVVVTSKKFWHGLLLYRKDFGGVLPPKAAWPILVYGLSSLNLRMKEQQKTALEVASFLESHPKVKKVIYPGLSSFSQIELAKKQMLNYEGEFSPGIMLYYTLIRNGKTTRKFLDYIARNAYSITLAVSLGQIRTLIESPSSMTHSALPASEQKKFGLDESGIRMSIGLEDPKDLIRDLDSALKIV